MPKLRAARAVAHSNIALVKYWGKRAGVDPALNLPAVGSLSMTLGELRTDTTVAPAPAGGSDRFELDGALVEGKPAAKVFAHLDRLHALAGLEGARPACVVTSINHLPTAAGLASSASGFAALTVAAAGAYGLYDSLDGAARTRLSGWSRQGSGSAARSLWGAFVRLDAGAAEDGSDCIARPLEVPAALAADLRLLVVHTARGAKKVGSTGGMESSRLTSPYYGPWVESSPADLDAAEAALNAQDFDALGAVMEHSCFKMHACMLATVPPLIYWNGTTLEVIREVQSVRADGGPKGFVTSDAGPHVKVLVRAAEAEDLAAGLAAVPGVHEVQAVAPGPAASLELL
ncbi:mevalonate diphosphate decarboxylase [Plesiocystis pacifica SIR-1]|uniref:diphosphomevalonate decarboxylase n=1 Tax=Plesiocystis pacifica SIR-1 TaxID=391625 RepID=A6G139_9BACT|nr:diphosphomevalonate decarboxylase [Plesiocystis pacifica]EDM80334.1 mevalonate diphosphate decarboxylase [Plesiocystis pacifica SIR-1]